MYMYAQADRPYCPAVTNIIISNIITISSLLWQTNAADANPRDPWV